MKGHNFGICRKCGKVHKTRRVQRITKICKCGCGNEFVCKINSNKKFLKGHISRRENNPGFGKIGSLNYFHIFKEKIRLSHRKVLICKKCFKEFETFQPNPKMLPKFCSSCINLGGRCIVCNKTIKLMNKYCKECEDKDTAKRMRINNPMKNKKTVKKVYDANVKNGSFQHGGSFGKLWKEKRKVMLQGVNSKYRKSEEYRMKLSSKTIKRYQRGDVSNCIGKCGRFFSDKNKKSFYYRSSYELLAFQLLESMINVISYDVNPISVNYNFDNKLHRYLIDLLVYYKDGSKQFIEVKARWRLKDEQTKRKIEAGKNYAKSVGCGFSIWTENELH